MSLHAHGQAYILTDISFKEISGAPGVYNFLASFNEGKNKKGEYVNTVISCEFWKNKQSDLFFENIHKGDSVVLFGRVRENRYLDEKQKKDVSKHSFRVMTFEFIRSARSSVDTPKPPADDNW